MNDDLVTLKFTHSGWFGICPVYIADTDKLVPTFTPRRVWMNALFMLSEAVFDLSLVVASALTFRKTVEWDIPVFVTDVLDPPLQLKGQWGERP